MRNATPLIALDAVVIDTETTGLDPRKARIVEFGGVSIAGGRLHAGSAQRQLVRPGEPIPPAATRIHGIDDAKVATAPDFAAAWPAIAGFLDDHVVIGHSVGFDVALLQHECRRIGTAWQPAAALDVALLAKAIEPELADHSVESLAAWLKVEVAGRHSALGDAMTTAQIFLALVPKLRERGIRTLAEAMRICRSRADTLDAQGSAGWSDVGAPLREELDAPAPRRDREAYRQRVAAVMHSPASFIASDATIGAALERMMRDKISSLFVCEREGEKARPEQTGIVTERDLLRAINVFGIGALGRPLRAIMSMPLATIPADALSYLAIGRMNRLQVRHLGVTDAAGQVAGALSARDLLRLRAEGAIELGDEIEQAHDVPELGRAWAKLARVATGLAGEELSGREIAALVSQGLAELTRRAAALAEAAMIAAGEGNAPCRYAVAVLGSAGRGESLLAMDQDNALVFADDAPAGADRWFEALGVRIADILHQVGVPYCQGGVMARNAQWRGDVATWRRRVESWVGRSNPQDLLAVDIFFDLNAVHGELAMADALWRDAYAAARGQAGFAKLLIESAGHVEAGRTWLGGIRTVEGRIDLKKAGLFGLVSVARALAVCHHVVERSTPHRLNGIKALGLGLDRDLEALVDAQGTFLDLILKQQIADIAAGIPPSNRVEVRRLSRRERERLGAALKAVEHLPDIAQDLLFKGSL